MYADTRELEIALRRAITLAEPLAAHVAVDIEGKDANEHPMAEDVRQWRRFVKEARVELGDLGVGALLTDD